MSRWRGHNVETFRDINRLLADIAVKGSQADADDLIETLEAANPRARDNIGYLAGYFDRDTGDKILKLFHTRHPVFGNQMPGASDVFALGQRIATQLLVCVGCGTAEPRHGVEKQPRGPLCRHCREAQAETKTYRPDQFIS